MNKFQILAGVILFGFVIKAHAIPSLSFFGDVDYDASTGIMSVHTSLINSEDIMPTPVLGGSSLDFFTRLDTVDATNPLFTAGLFTGVPGDDITVIGGDSTLLLTGEFSDLMLRGFNDSVLSGSNSGQLSGVINATGGILAAMYGEGSLLALEFNLSTVFSPNMYRDSFSGFIDGSIDGVTVPEPMTLTLLGLGLALIGANRKIQAWRNQQK